MTAYGPELTYRCHHRCGWYRHYRDNEAWNERITVHPIYGPVTNAALVTRDIEYHDCDEYLAARDRRRVFLKLTGERKVIYNRGVSYAA